MSEFVTLLVDEDCEIGCCGNAIGRVAAKREVHDGIFAFAHLDGIGIQGHFRHRVHFERIVVGDGTAASRNSKGSQVDTVVDVVEARRISGFQCRGIFKGAVAVGQPLERDIVARDFNSNGLRLVNGAMGFADKGRHDHHILNDKHRHLIREDLTATIDSEGQRGLTVGEVLRSRGVDGHRDGGIIEGAVTRSGPLQVVIIDGVTHDLGVVAFADGHVVACSARHDAVSRKTDIVDPSAVAAIADATVLGVGPLVGVAASSDGIGGLGPTYIA